MNNLPNNWDLQSIMALTYIKGMHYNECRRAVERYANYVEFKNNAFNIRQGTFFDAADAKEKSSLEVAEMQIELAERLGIKIISAWDSCYPVLLKQIDYPPTILYVWGQLQQADALSISVVGTRKNTNYGKLATEYFVSEFVKQNIVITSGMAHGIDTIAHRTVMQNKGTTYAVIASGLDKIVPKMQHQFANEIVNSGGAIISEYKLGTSALQGYFLQRNRIISGISKATLVVESAYRGGALNTAKFSESYSRDTFVVPGSIFSEKSEGTNNLIHKSKSLIALSPQSVLKDIGATAINFTQTKPSTPQFNSQTEELLYNNISHEPIHIDIIASLTNLDISEVLVQLLEMEFNGLVRQLPGKYYIREL